MCYYGWFTSQLETQRGGNIVACCFLWVNPWPNLKTGLIGAGSSRAVLVSESLWLHLCMSSEIAPNQQEHYLTGLWPRLLRPDWNSILWRAPEAANSTYCSALESSQILITLAGCERIGKNKKKLKVTKKKEEALDIVSLMSSQCPIISVFQWCSFGPHTFLCLCFFFDRKDRKDFSCAILVLTVWWFQPYSH